MRLTNHEIKELTILRAITKRHCVNGERHRVANNRYERYVYSLARKYRCEPQKILSSFIKQKTEPLWKCIVK